MHIYLTENDFTTNSGTEHALKTADRLKKVDPACEIMPVMRSRVGPKPRALQQIEIKI